MQEPSSTSDDEESQSHVLREGEKEIKQITSFSLLSLMKMNKQVASDVNASNKQSIQDLKKPPVPELKQRKTTLQPSLQNPREFLINYIINRNATVCYTFQNSRNLSLHSEYKEYFLFFSSLLIVLMIMLKASYSVSLKNSPILLVKLSSPSLIIIIFLSLLLLI